MNFFIPDIARSAEDFERAAELIARTSTAAYVPPLGEKNNVTYVLRGEKDRSLILGVTHVEWAPEVRCLVVDPEYKDAQRAAYMMLQRGMEMDLRKTGVPRYYMTVPPLDQRVMKIFTGEPDCVTIDDGMVRFMKVL